MFKKRSLNGPATGCSAVLPLLLLVLPLSSREMPAQQAGSPLQQNPLDAGLLPVGALAQGTTSLTQEGDVFRFRFTGDEDLVYAIDTAHAEVRGGVLRIQEETTGVYPFASAGMSYRTATGLLLGPGQLASHCTLQSTVAEGDTLTLTFTDQVHGEPPRSRSTEIRIVGKALEVRCRDLDLSTAATSNYAGFEFGPVTNAGNPKDLKIPGMISVPVALFTSLTTGQKAFVSTQVNWVRSNASTFHQPAGYSNVLVSGDTISNSYSMAYWPDNAGALNAPVDETVWAVVSRNLESVFAETEAAPTPYRNILAGRPVCLATGSSTAWSNYATMWQVFADHGMDNLANYFFYWWSSWTPTENQVPTHLWVPAKDETNFMAMLSAANSHGFLNGLYTLFSPKADQAHHDPSDRVVDHRGNPSPYMSPSRQLSHSLREDGELRSRYGTSLVFTDVIGYQNPGNNQLVDHDANHPDKSKTIGQAVIDLRRLFRQMQEIHEGPMLSEGSIGTIDTNYELLYAGFVDSTEATINTGSGFQASALSPNHSLAPENWWVLPDYSLRVTNRAQANHSNGFHQRFFAGITTPDYPLGEERLDRYRLYEITYGKTGYFQSNGPFNGPGNYTYLADMVKEYYMMQALQEDYLSADVSEVLYDQAGVLVDASALLKGSASANPLDDFRHPRLKIVWSGGLTVWANHSTAPWSGITAANRSFTIPEDGFVAWNPSTGLLAFSAIPSDVVPAGSRIDHVFAPNRYEVLDGRGAVSSYGGLTNSSQRLVVKNLVRNLQVTENATNGLSTASLGPNALTTIALLGPSFFRPGERGLVKARGVWANGAGQEISHTLGTWTSSDPTVATVNRAGVVTAIDTGTTVITFTSGGVTSTGLSVQVSKVPPMVAISPAAGPISGNPLLVVQVSDQEGLGDIESLVVTTRLDDFGGVVLNLWPGMASLFQVTIDPQGALLLALPDLLQASLTELGAQTVTATVSDGEHTVSAVAAYQLANQPPVVAIEPAAGPVSGNPDLVVTVGDPDGQGTLVAVSIRARLEAHGGIEVDLWPGMASLFQVSVSPSGETTFTLPNLLEWGLVNYGPQTILVTAWDSDSATSVSAAFTLP